MKKFLIIIIIIVIIFGGIKFVKENYFPNAGRLYDEKYVYIRQIGEEKLAYFTLLVSDTLSGKDTGIDEVNSDTLNYITDKYICLNDVGGADYFNAIGFDENIFNHYGNSYNGEGEVNNDTCSLIRKVDDGYEFLLIANPSGEYAIDGIVNYVNIK